jgi:hypothetical protein
MGRDPDGLIALPAAEFEALLERAAETGARRALHEVGLDGQDAPDIRDYAERTVMRSRGREVQVATGFDGPKHFA